MVSVSRPCDPEYRSSLRDELKIEPIRRTLNALGQSIQKKRVALARHAEQARRLDQEWDDMLEAHRTLRKKLEASGGMTRQILEGLNSI